MIQVPSGTGTRMYIQGTMEAHLLLNIGMCPKVPESALKGRQPFCLSIKLETMPTQECVLGHKLSLSTNT